MLHGRYNHKKSNFQAFYYQIFLIFLHLNTEGVNQQKEKVEKNISRQSQLVVLRDYLITELVLKINTKTKPSKRMRDLVSSVRGLVVLPFTFLTLLLSNCLHTKSYTVYGSNKVQHLKLEWILKNSCVLVVQIAMNVIKSWSGSLCASSKFNHHVYEQEKLKKRLTILMLR